LSSIVEVYCVFLFPSPGDLVDRVFFLEAPDGFLKDRLANLPITKVEERHLENNYEQLLGKYREENEAYEKSALAYFDEQEAIYIPIDVVSDESLFMKKSVTFISVILGRPRNYGKAVNITHKFYRGDEIGQECFTTSPGFNPHRNFQGRGGSTHECPEI